MGKSVKSSLYFDDYIVDNISFKNNPKFISEKTQIDFSVFPQIAVEGSNMIVSLTVDIFKNAVKNNYPFEMSLTILGYFSMHAHEEDILQYKRNAIAILYPFARAIVSSYTANANVNPLILPAINVNKLIEMQNMESEKPVGSKA